MLIRQIIILSLSFTFCLMSYGQPISENNIQFDTSKVAIISLDSSANNISKLFKSVAPAQLVPDDLTIIELVLIRFIKDYNLEQEKQYEKIKTENPKSKININSFVIDLSKYKRQYVATINKKGEKEVWVNCFCDSWNEKWREYLILAFEGGNCYFNLKINLNTGEYYDLIVNEDF